MSVRPSAPAHRRLPARRLGAGAAIVTAMLSLGAQAPERPVVTVGIVYDGQSPEGRSLSPERLRGFAERIAEETLALTWREFDVRFPADKVLSGEWDLERMNAAIDQLLDDPATDVVLTLGVYVSNVACKRARLPKPVIAPFIVDRQAQEIPFDPGPDSTVVSGVENLNYVTGQDSLSEESAILRDIRKFLELVPFRRLHVVADALVPAAIPEVRDNVIEQGRSLGLEMALVTAIDRAAPVLDALPADTEAVYVTPLHRMPEKEFDALVEGLKSRRIPSFSLLGQTEVERGLMAGLRADTGNERLARRIALNIQRILKGENAGRIPVVQPVQGGLSINQRTARAVGVPLRWRVRIEAHLIDDDGGMAAAPELTLFEAVNAAIAANLDLRATDRRVAAGQQQVRQSRAAYLPQVDLSARGLVVDEDTAEASFGTQPERSFGGTLGASQVLWSDPLVATIQIAEREQAARTERREAARLDVALDTATAFLDVLRAETLERVARENLQLTEDHLELAVRRRAVGASGPAEVFRWESELAAARIAVIAAQNRVSAARVALNRLLDRALEQPARLVTPALDDPRLVTCCDRLDPYVEGPDSYSVFRDFSVEDGLRNSPELRALDEAIAARQRVLTTARRSYWSPDVRLQASAGRLFWREGAGTEPPGFTIPLDPPVFVPVGADRPRDSLSVGVQAGLPLYRGGARQAEVRRAREELAALEIDRAALAQRIEALIRATMFDAGTTFPAIELSRESAAASRKNLELLTDSYARGVISIIDLLDAQRSALIAEQYASNAEYNFLVDLMRVQRATSSFDFFTSEEGMQAWFDRLRAYFEARGLTVRPSRHGAH